MSQSRIYLMPDGSAVDLSKIIAVTEIRDMQAWHTPVVGEKEFVKSGQAFEIAMPFVNLSYYIDEVGEETPDRLIAAWIAFYE